MLVVICSCSRPAYSPVRIRSSGTFAGQTRNTVFRSRGGGPEHRTVSCVPVVFGSEGDRNTGQCPVFRSCSGLHGSRTRRSAAVYRLAAPGGEVLLRGIGASPPSPSTPSSSRPRGWVCTAIPPIPPLAFAMFFRTNRFKSNQGCPPSFTTGHIVHLAHDPCVKGEGGQPWFVLFMCFRLKTGQNWPANARVNGYRVLAVQTGPARTEGSIKSH